MFIIKNGVGYKINGDKAVKIDFDENGNMILLNDEIEVEKTDVKYTYGEMYRKLNVAYFTKLKKLTPKQSSFSKPKKDDKKGEENKKEEKN